MISFSRRSLAHYGVEQLLAGQSATAIAKRLAAVLVSSGKQKEVDLLLLDIDQELEDRGLVARVRVTAGHPLSAQLRQKLSIEVKKTTKVKQVILSETVDESVIGSLKVETANHSWDKTIVRQLADIRKGI